MNKAKSSTTNDSIENPIQVLKTGTCPTSSGKSTLTYQIGIDESGGIHLKVSGNDGGGFWSAEWVSYTDIKAALEVWPADQGVTSMTFRKIFRGKSANTPGFLVAVLCAEAIIEPMGDKKRVHQACDLSVFLTSVATLRKGAGNSTSKKPAPKAKAAPRKTSTAKAATTSATTKSAPSKSIKANSKTATARSAKTPKTPRKTTARSKKAS